MTRLPRPANFDSILGAGRAGARDGWPEFSHARLALIVLVAHAGLEIVQARVVVDGSTEDAELWVQLPSGALGAVAFRSCKGPWGLSGFCTLRKAHEQKELHSTLRTRLGLDRETEPCDVYRDLLAEMT